MTQNRVVPLPLDAPVPGASFTDLLDSLGAKPTWSFPPGDKPPAIREGTTVLAVRFDNGVVMAGDRRATEGHFVAHRRIRKVFPADSLSAVAIAGTAGLAIEMVKLFQVELEHYEKIEGVRLSLEGKASFLARLVRGQLPMAFQGLVVVPLFAGFDEREDRGRLYSFDVVGGRYEEIDFGGTGSGFREAKAFMRTEYRDDMTGDEAAELAVRALVAAAQEDTATGGPDLRRGILPNVLRIDADGVVELDDDEILPIAERAVEMIQ
ncbi:MAG: proteasome subunit beta [Acidobacteria bacterium]|nr:proteasome subunit beta [Acidobacteriota bacterium]MCZ6662188.1 proteasome subunit beta [Actinomycetota bacterium]